MRNWIRHWRWHSISEGTGSGISKARHPVGFRPLLIATVLTVLGGGIAFGKCGEAKAEMSEAIRFAQFYNWPEAGPHAANAERRFRACGNRRNALFAHVLELRATMEQRNLAELSSELSQLLTQQSVQHDPELQMWTYIAKGDADNDLQYPKAARHDWTNVKALATEIRNVKWTYRAEGELSISAYYEGDISAARRLVTSALTSASEAHDWASVVRLLTHIGTVYVMLEQYGDGLEHLNKALEIANAHSEIGYPINVKEGQVLGLIGENRLDEAERLALEIVANTEGRKRLVNEAQTLVMLASIYRNKGETLKAVATLKKAVGLASAGSFQQSLADGEYALADIYREQGRLTEAETYATRAVNSTRNSGILSDLPERMGKLAALKVAEGKYEDADQLYQKAADEVDALLLSTPATVRGPLVKSTSDIYIGHFSLIAEHFPDVNKAYAVVEQVRGRSVADLLRSGWVAPTAEAETVEREISNLRLELAKATSVSAIAQIRDHIFFAQHKRWLTSTTATSLGINVHHILPLRMVEQGLGPSDLLVEYVAAKDRYYAICITSVHARLVRLTSTKDISDLAITFLDAIRSKESAMQQGAALYKALMEPITEIATHPHLVIAPDGLLYSIPFAALVDSGGERLVVTHTVLRAPSASTYIRLQEPTTINSGGLLAVGGVSYNSDTARIAQRRGYEDESLGNLPGSRDEALAAAARLRPLMKADLLLDRSATETAFKNAQLPSREVIHLGVHSTASPNDAEKAALVLLSDPKADEDGILEIPEILHLHLHADLVVLSGCDTGVGMVQGEEGISTLSRAFLLAGAHTVVSTLWQVDDSFSATLMKDFYSALANGYSKSDSLVIAQRNLLRRFSGTAVPYYWAGYVIEGSADTALTILQSQQKTAVSSTLMDYDGHHVP